MALVINDRVKESTTTTGTGTVTLGGAVQGFETFLAGIGNSNTTYYAIVLNAEFEVGLGTLASDSSTLARTTIISSSNSDNAVDFSAGSKEVFCCLPASKSTVLDANNNLTLPAKFIMPDVTSAKILVADGTSYEEVAVSGDVTIASSGAITIANNAVETAMINADAVTGAKIADNAINSEHYTDGSIDTAHIADSQITNAKMADNAIDTAEIAASAVETAKINDAAVTTAKITDGNVTTAKIAADAITGAKIADNAINSEHYTDGSIDTAHIANDQITNDLMADDAIGADQLAANAVVNASVASNAAIVDTKLATISTANKVDIGALDIDGASDIGAALADADLIIVDDGANGTEKKSAMSRVKTYIADVTLTTAAQTNITSLGTLTTLTVDNIIINGTNIGHTSDTDSLAIAADGVITFSQRDIHSAGITVADGGQIGSASDVDAIAIGSDGDVTLTQDLELQHDGAILSFGANDEIALTHVHDTGLLLTDSGGSPTLQLHNASEAVSSDGSKLILTSNGVAFSLPTADGDDGQVMKTNGSGVFSFTDVSATALAADNLSIGDAAILLTTSSGNITIDAAANDSDIILKGTDGGADITMATFDGSDAGTLILNHDLTLPDGGKTIFGAGSDLQIQHDGSHSYIQNSTGNLNLQGKSGEDSVVIIPDGGVQLSHNNVKKFETTAAGVDVVGTITPSGVITADAGVVVDNITIDGTQIDLSSGDLTLDVAGDIILDTAGGQVYLAKAGTNIGRIEDDGSQNFRFASEVQDKDITFAGNDGGSGIIALTLDMSAGGAATFSSDVTAFSDERLKENIETIPNALDKVCQMRGVTFNRTDFDGEKQMGVIAQEVEKIIPEVVKEDDSEDKIKSVAYGNMVGVLIEAIKDLKAEVDDLKSQLPHEHNEGIFKDLDKINRS